MLLDFLFILVRNEAHGDAAALMHCAIVEGRSDSAVGWVLLPPPLRASNKIGDVLKQSLRFHCLLGLTVSRVFVPDEPATDKSAPTLPSSEVSFPKS
jgi:hypothetical protein